MKPNCSNCLRHSIDCDYNSTSLSRDSSATPSTEVKAPTSLDGNHTFISSSQSNFAPPKRAHGPRRAPAQQHDEKSSQLDQAIINKPFQFTATDMALFHHFITSKDLGASHTRIYQLGFSFHYVLRLALAFSGFHLARHSANSSFTGLNKTDLHAVAEQHYEIAVREVTALRDCRSRSHSRNPTSRHNQQSCTLCISNIHISLFSCKRTPARGISSLP